MKNVIIVTGSAGSGLSSAEYVFEELGYFVIKNIPSSSISSVLDDLVSPKSKFENICIVVHAIEAKETFKNVLDRKDATYRYIVLGCDEEELFKRYALTRRVHPRSVTQKISPNEAIKQDIRDISDIKKYANLYIDTTSLTVKQLRAKLYKFVENVEESKITSVTFLSFGLKNGIPQGIDIFFDVRQIPNPYWVEDLKELTGEDVKVITYMNSFPITEQTILNIESYLDKVLPLLQQGGRGNYTIGIACSGGQHRSTYVANVLAKHYSNDYRVQVIHRDCPQLNKE